MQGRNAFQKDDQIPPYPSPPPNVCTESCCVCECVCIMRHLRFILQRKPLCHSRFSTPALCRVLHHYAGICSHACRCQLCRTQRRAGNRRIRKKASNQSLSPSCFPLRQMKRMNGQMKYNRYGEKRGKKTKSTQRRQSSAGQPRAYSLDLTASRRNLTFFSAGFTGRQSSNCRSSSSVSTDSSVLTRSSSRSPRMIHGRRYGFDGVAP